MQKVDCLNCGATHDLDEKNVYQDIKGKYMICLKCESTFDVEPLELSQLEMDSTELQANLVIDGWQITDKRGGNFDAAKDNLAVEISISSGETFEVDFYVSNRFACNFAEPYFEDVSTRIYDEAHAASSRKRGRTS